MLSLVDGDTTESYAKSSLLYLIIIICEYYTSIFQKWGSKKSLTYEDTFDALAKDAYITLVDQ